MSRLFARLAAGPALTFSLCMALGSTGARAADEDKEKPKFEGFVRSLVEVQSVKNGEVWHEGRLDFKSKRKKGFRAEVEFEIETKDDSLDVLELVLDCKLEDNWRWEAGYTQKRMGVEYEENRLERPTIERSYLYRRLELFGYVGRENVFRLRRENDQGQFNDWSLTTAFSESQNASLIANWQTSLAGTDARYGVWGFLGTDKTQDDAQTVVALMNSLWYRGNTDLWQLEWVIGLDPQQSEFERLFADHEKVYFSGVNGLLAQEVYAADEEAVQLLVGGNLLLNDHRRSKYNTIGFMLGARYTFGDLRVSLNGELIGTNTPLKLGNRTYDQSSLTLEALYEI